MSSGPESEGEEFKKSFQLDALSEFEPSQLDNLRSETATIQADSATDNDNEAFKPASGSVTEDDSVTEDNTPPATPKKQKSKGKATKAALSDDDLNFNSPPARMVVVKPAQPKIKVKPLPPQKKRSVKPSAKILAALATPESDSDKSDGPPKKKLKVPQGGAKSVSKSNQQPPPETLNAKAKVSKRKSTFRKAVKEQVYIKTEPGRSDDEKMVSIPYLSRSNIS